jgi:hypothetical protein
LVAAEGFFAGLGPKVTASGPLGKGSRFFVTETTADDRRPETTTYDDAQNRCPDWKSRELTTPDADT